ncbi:DUF3488 and transglutaminase-like domain-containing protein [Lentzea sp. NPDC051208]|uniref:transglutaminase TgpA family protein n=1 Tax=Lentzea sp. NPDC051208 TaxID=3154642 RepID=UPI003412E909
MSWRRLLPGATAAEVTLAVAASAAGALVYLQFFASPDYLVTTGIAGVVGGATAALGHRRPTWFAVLLATTNLSAVIVFGVFHGTYSAVFDGLHGSWNRLLTTAVPADPWGELLAVPILMTWTAASSSALLVLTTRNVLSPLVPPLLAFVFAIFVVGNQAATANTTATIVFLVAALPLIAMRAHRCTGGATVRFERHSPRSLSALTVVALLLGISALVGIAGSRTLPLASGTDRFDPRDVFAPPVKITDALTPLSRVKSQLKEKQPRTLFTMRLTREDSRKIDRVRTAALDVFDGNIWTSSDTYRTAGSRLTADPALTQGTPVTARIELNDLPGPYLPVIGWPSRLNADGTAQDRFGFDPDSGVVVGTTTNLRGLTYEVTGEVTGRDYGPLSRTIPTSERVPDLPPGMPDSLRMKLTEFTKTTPFEKLLSLEMDLRTRPNLLDGPPGQSYAAVANLIDNATSGAGFAEQHVSAFTMLARAWGYPARIAVGYQLNDYKDGGFQVTTLQAYAWSEVHFAGYGWVSFDPAPPVGGERQTPPTEVPRVAPPPPASPSTSSTTNGPVSPLPDEVAEAQGYGWNGVPVGVLLLVPGIFLFLMFAAGFVVFAKARRRKRRRSAPDQAARVLGAWHELLDRLTEQNVSPPVSLTFHEVAEHARSVLGDKANLIADAAEIATTAIYAPDHVGRSEADQAWQLEERLRTELHSRRVSAGRLVATLDPRPLWTRWTAARRQRQAREGLEMGRYR